MVTARRKGSCDLFTLNIVFERDPFVIWQSGYFALRVTGTSFLLDTQEYRVFFSGAFIRLDVENLVQINFIGLALEQRNPMVTDFSLDGKDNFSNSIYCPISTVIPDRAIP